jgi:predicted acyltransferase
MTSDISIERPVPARLHSLDAFRGLVMLMMASAGLGVAAIAKAHPDSRVLAWLGHNSDHAAWVGCTLWDLIQPAFMFMVGVAVPFSIASRQSRGQSFARMFAHALWRSLLLVLLGVYLASNWGRRTNWLFTNVLAQIGLGYPFLFVLAFTKTRTVWIVAGAILLATTLAFLFYPLPPANFDWNSVGVPANWPHFTGVSAHYEKNANVFAAFDRWLLNHFPRQDRFVYEPGGYQTLNFVPALATMIFGLLAGRLLKSGIPLPQKVGWLVAGGVAGLALGFGLHLTGLCPMVKRIWTPSFALFSTGWVLLALAFFVIAIDATGFKGWAWPLIVAGLNPLALYMLWQLSGGYIKSQMRIHFGQDVFIRLGTTYTALMERALVLLVIWLILWWMHRRKIYLRL